MKLPKHRICRIVLTGGPCGGKTTIMQFLIDELTKKGVIVLVRPEAATLCILGGMHPGFEHIGAERAQRAIIKTNKALNDIWMECAKSIDLKDGTALQIVILEDRDTADSHAYTEEDLYRMILSECGTSHEEILSGPDGVLHLVTTADGAIEAYTLSNNGARFETPEQAIEKDRLLQKAWLGTHKLKVIPNRGSFEQKKQDTLNEVLAILGMPVPVEREKKFLVRLKGDIPVPCTRQEISQFYCHTPNRKDELRMRMITMGKHVHCVQTHKSELGDGGRLETETPIPYESYAIGLNSLRDPGYGIIEKERACFLLGGHYAEMDTFHHVGLLGKDPKLRLMEVEYTSEEPRIVFPDWLELVEDVTDNSHFRNRNMAARALN